MLNASNIAVLILLSLIVVLQMRRAVGLMRAVVFGGLGLLAISTVWGSLEWSQRLQPPMPRDLSRLPPVSSESCMKCHPSHYESWKHTYHRTMTRDATPEFVKGDFNNAVMSYNGIESRMTRVGDKFYFDTIDPVWESQVLSRGKTVAEAGPIKRISLSIDRVVGSHWMQQYFHLGRAGRYYRLPLVYHMVENRWIHINGAFVGPNPPQFFAGVTYWNSSCIYCHNTRPAGNPYPLPNDPVPGFRSTVGELGIACEACHSASERHIQAHENPARRIAQLASSEPDPTIVNPAELSIHRADDVCARCHGAPLVRFSKWDQSTLADPFLAGEELNETWRVCWSQAEMDQHATEEGFLRGSRKSEGKIDGRFWGDGTPLTTALEFQGIALSKCYEKGEGKLSCLTCHSMHNADPNHMVKEGMRTNEACFGCHESYRSKLAEHTHHGVDSAGSQCMNCHMPHQVYSLLDTHRSHRISVPRVRDSIGTGKPHACNLCHLDKSLGWTSDQLQEWYGTPPEELSEDDRNIASSILLLTRGDARSRSIVAGAFASPAAQKASGRDWPGLLLTDALRQERYEAIRFLLYRSLRSLYGLPASDYNFQGLSSEREAQLQKLDQILLKQARPDRSKYPDLPLDDEGRFKDVLNQWMKNRSDPDVSISE